IVAVAVDELGEELGVDERRVEMLDGLGIALLPVLEHAAVEALGPERAALEEPELELGEAAGDAAEEQRLADRLATVGEAADLVVLVPRHRGVGAPADRTGVEGRGDA